MLVIANSRKLGGRCLAGISLDDGSLLRPVGPAPRSELYLSQCNVEGRQPALLEVVEFDHLGHDGDDTQPENVVIAETPWSRGDQIPRAEALAMLRDIKHTEAHLFGNFGKAVHADVAVQGLPESLLVVEPEKIRFEHRAHAHARVLFRHAGRDWDLPLTDFDVYPKVLAAPVGTYMPESLGLMSTLLLTISLALPHNNFHSKLIASVLQFE